jgi:hypothetical protein
MSTSIRNESLWTVRDRRRHVSTDWDSATVTTDRLGHFASAYAKGLERGWLVRGEIQWRVSDVDAFSPDAFHLPIAHGAGADEATAPESVLFEGPVVARHRRTAAHVRHLVIPDGIHEPWDHEDLRRAKALRRVARVETDPAAVTPAMSGPSTTTSFDANSDSDGDRASTK